MTNQSHNIKRRLEQRAKYVAAIKTCQSFHDLAAALGIQVGAARAYIRKTWADLPADSRPEWLADAIVPVSAQQSGKMGGRKKKTYKMIARSKPKTGAAQQLAVLSAKPPKAVSLKPLPPNLVIEGAEKWGKLCQPAP